MPDVPYFKGLPLVSNALDSQHPVNSAKFIYPQKLFQEAIAHISNLCIRTFQQKRESADLYSLSVYIRILANTTAKKVQMVLEPGLLEKGKRGSGEKKVSWTSKERHLNELICTIAIPNLVTVKMSHLSKTQAVSD